MLRFCCSAVTGRRLWSSTPTNRARPIARKVSSGRHSVSRSLEACQLMLGYRFKRLELLQEALAQKKNQRLALVGDRALNIVLANRVFHSTAQLSIVTECDRAMSNKWLHVVGLHRGLHRYMTPALRFSMQELRLETNADLKKAKHVADAMEALVGAVFEDQLAATGTIDWTMFDSMIFRLGIVPEPLTTYHDRRLGLLRTSRKLPSTFFKGHQARLDQELFDYAVISTQDAPEPLPKTFRRPGPSYSTFKPPPVNSSDVSLSQAARDVELERTTPSQIDRLDTSSSQAQEEVISDGNVQPPVSRSDVSPTQTEKKVASKRSTPPTTKVISKGNGPSPVSRSDKSLTQGEGKVAVKSAEPSPVEATSKGASPPANRSDVSPPQAENKAASKSNGPPPVDRSVVTVRSPPKAQDKLTPTRDGILAELLDGEDESEKKDTPSKNNIATDESKVEPKPTVVDVKESEEPQPKPTMKPKTLKKLERLEVLLTERRLSKKEKGILKGLRRQRSLTL